MDGLEEKLSAILNDPNSMEQILSLAKNLGIGSPPSTSSSEQAAPVSTPEDTSAPLLDEKMLHTFLSIVKYTANPKQHQRKKKEKSSGRNIWTDGEYRRTFDGKGSF